MKLKFLLTALVSSVIFNQNALCSDDPDRAKEDSNKFQEMSQDMIRINKERTDKARAELFALWGAQAKAQYDEKERLTAEQARMAAKKSAIELAKRKLDRDKKARLIAEQARMAAEKSAIDADEKKLDADEKKFKADKVAYRSAFYESFGDDDRCVIM
jgi:hypothetical protein